MIKISIIVAIAENFAIGKNNQLLWHIPNDLKRFKKITSGHTVIMGKKTYESLPVHPLPNRRNIVISDNLNDRYEGCIMAFSINEAIELCDKNNENFIIGGGSVYKQFLPYAVKLYLTVVHKNFEADIFFPPVNFNEWKEIERTEKIYDKKNDFSYSFVTYVKMKRT